MNSKTNKMAVTLRLCAGLLLGAAATAMADSTITFQVDMSVALTNGTFNPATQAVAVRGTFTGWGSGFFGLTNNPGGANPNLYTGTTNILTAIAANGTTTDFKFTLEGGGTVYEGTTLDGNNRVFQYPTNNGGALVVPVAYFNDVAPNPPGTPTNLVTFQVNMAQQINVGAFDPSTGVVYANGSFNGFNSSFFLTNDPSIRTTNKFGAVTTEVYTGVTPIVGAPGAQIEYKFVNGSSYESPVIGDPDNNNNRFAKLTGAPETLPIVDFSDLPYAPTYTNNVTFQLDMTVQVGNGNFNPANGDYVQALVFNFAGNPRITLTNNPSAANTNLYTGTFPFIAGVGTTPNIQYKFWNSNGQINSGYELPISTGGGNRQFDVQQVASQVLPAVYWNDASPSSGLSQNTLVTFRVSMTNAVGVNAYVFNPSVDFVALNGVTTINPTSGGFWGWAGSEADGLAAHGTGLQPEPPEFDMTNYPAGSQIYQVTVQMPAGASFAINYKYGIDAADDEAGFALNHQRYIRTDTGSYTLPLDTFGVQTVEIAFGNLAIGAPSGGTIPITWLGLPNVHLQTSTDLSAGFTDHPETAGMSGTNYPFSSGNLFFRLAQH